MRTLDYNINDFAFEIIFLISDSLNKEIIKKYLSILEWGIGQVNKGEDREHTFSINV